MISRVAYGTIIGTIIVTIIIVCIVIFTSNAREGFKQPAKSIAIVTMMRDPIDLDEWINYHLLKGISRFYIRIETTGNSSSDDITIKLLTSYPQVTLHVGSPDDISTINDADLPGQSQMLRQRSWVADAIRRALADGIEWIVHIDSDELLECNGTVGEAIDLDATDETHTMVINNFEAVYAKNKKEGQCFTFESLNECALGKCVSYANGKSIGRVTPYLREAGVHRFRYVGTGEDKHTNMRALYLIHFESCDFGKYVDKFMKLSKSERLAFPFPYYNDSIAVANGDACRANGESKICRSAFTAVYKKYRMTE